MSLLQARNLTHRFGGVTAISNVSFDVEHGEILAIIGPNGAGKSTLFNIISRIYQPDSGELQFRGHPLLNRRASDIAGLGIARTFQNIELFEHSTVLENLLIGRHTRSGTSVPLQLFFAPSVRREEIAHRESVERIIDFLDLHAYRDTMIAGLPYGARKVVELGRALALEPHLVLLDEPGSGLSPEESQDLQFWISDIRSLLGITVVMIEHDMTLVSAVADRVLALADGRVIALGTLDEVRSHPQVVQAYLGADAEASA